MSRRFLLCGVMVLGLLTPMRASADVIYELSGELGGDTFGFVYTAPDFITPPLTVPAADLDSCDPFDFAFCQVVAFGATELTFASWEPGVGQAVLLLSFPAGYLSTPGMPPSGNPDIVLTVRAQAVPEPVVLSLVGLGFACHGVRRWKRVSKPPFRHRRGSGGQSSQLI